MAFLKEQAAEYLERAVLHGRLAHAYLVTGARGSGKRWLAGRLCDLTDGNRKGGGMERIDVHRIEPESKSRRIAIGQVRGLEQSLRMKATGAGVKVGVVAEAERMGAEAANAFLKTLEEPPGNTLLLLLTSQPEALLDTIRSRCISVPLMGGGIEDPTPEEDMLLQMLDAHASRGDYGTGPALRLAAGFLRILSGIRESIQQEQDDDYQSEREKYRQTTEGKWLADREEHYKAVGESLYILERNRMVETLSAWWAQALRSGGMRAHPAMEREGAARLAESFERMEVIGRLSRIDALRDHLGRNIQEAMAVEAAFLEIFTRR